MQEFRLLRHVFDRNPRFVRLGESSAQRAVTICIPPGDDMGMVRVLHDSSLIRSDISGADVLAAVDQVVAGVHFDTRSTPVELIGRKAVSRSLSDIAAMAAAPVGSLAAVVLPRDFTEEQAQRLFDAMAETADAFDCPLFGGDIAVHEGAGSPLTCSVTVLARPIDSNHPPILRSGAQPGDAVYVTGLLGGSLGDDRLGRHLTFEPRIREAIALYEHLGTNLHAMIDISDGLGRDLGHIAAASLVRIEIETESIPCNECVDWRRAVREGEDYELAFAAAGDVPRHLGSVQVTRIGRIVERVETADEARIHAIEGDDTIDLTESGWQHE